MPLICEKCGKPMVLRMAKRGKSIGQQFYGCSGFPNCRNIVNIEASSNINGIECGDKVSVQNNLTGKTSSYTIIRAYTKHEPKIQGAYGEDSFAVEKLDYNLKVGEEISNTSPLGKALLGHISGETITFDSPKGKESYKIIEILKPKQTDKTNT